MPSRVARHLCGVFVAITLISRGTGFAEQRPRDERAIRAVEEGRRTEARASWWGFCGEDATAALQAAIDSGARTVVVEKMPGPWIVTPIQLADNQKIVFEPGVVVEAKRGAFHGRTDSLFTAWNRTNIHLSGHGATLRMHREDYDGPDYEKAEWRHVLSFRGCTDVTVEGLTLSESGGDGVYLGTGRNRQTNRNVIIRDVVCDRNYRQGISVITAENLLIENCVLKNTAGTAPAAGIDFEPNHPWERLVNCVMRDCVIEDNQGLGIHLYLRFMNGTSEPVSIRIENCVVRGTHATSASVVTGCGPEGPVRGLVEFVNCRFLDEGRAGIRIGSKPPDGLELRFVDCTIADPSPEPELSAPLQFSTRPGDLETTGGVAFENLVVHEQVERPLMVFRDPIGFNLGELTGTITVERQAQRTQHVLDREVVASWIPFDPVLELPIVAWDPQALEPIAWEPAEMRLPHHRVRITAVYLLQAAAGDRVALRFRHQAVGRHPGDPMPVRAISPTGKELEPTTVVLGEEAEYEFTADASGLFAVHCEPGRHTVQLVAASHPVAIAGAESLIRLLSTVGEFYFWVPGGVEQFGLRFQGEGEGERFTATVRDAEGHIRWHQANIGYPESFTVSRDPTAAGQVWQLHIERPEIGVLEDIHIVIRGLPALLALQPEGLLRPAD